MNPNRDGFLGSKTAGISIGIASGFFVLGMIASNLANNNPPQQFINCYEDEVIIWHDNSHSKCWPIDDIWMLEEID